MRLFSKIKSLFKKGKTIVLEEIEIHTEYKKLKQEILNSQTIKELKNMCKEFELKETQKDLYSEHIDKHIDLDQIIEYCENKKINISQTLKKKQTIDKKYIKHTLGLGKNSKNNFELEIKPKIDIKLNLKNK